MPRRTAEDAAQTRDKILDAGLEVFAERGFAAAQLEDIARRAGVTRGALYHHFDDKAELWRTVLEARWETTAWKIFAPLHDSGTPRARLGAFVASFVRLARTDTTVRALLGMSISGDASLLADEAGMEKKGDALASWTKRLDPIFAEAGYHADSRKRARLLVTFLQGVAVTNAIAPRQAPSADDGDAVAKLLLDGLLR